MLGVNVFWKLQIQPDISSDSTDVETICIYKVVKKNKAMWRYIEALEFHNGAPKVHWSENTGWIFFVEYKRVTPRVKNIAIAVCFLLDFFDNGILVPEYEKYSVIP